MGKVPANSAHKITRCNIYGEINIKGNAILVPNYKRGNIQGLKLVLQKNNWQTVFGSKSTELLCSTFTNILFETESKRADK